MSILLIILGLVLFVALVVVHEFGHFIAAKKSGVEVDEFGVGFPPRARVLTKKNGTTYTLNWLPIGGFVKLKGEHDADQQPGSYGAASLRAKAKILLAGVGMNLLVALTLFTALAWIGIPKLVDDQYAVKSDTKVIRNDVLVGYVEPNSPAENARRYDGDLQEKDSLRIRDRITKIQLFPTPGETEGVDAFTINSQQQLHDFTSRHSIDPIIISIERDGKPLQLYTELRSAEEVNASLKTDNPKGYLGIAPTEYTLSRSTWSAPVVALGLAKQFTILTFKGLGSALGALFKGDTAKASEQVSGPIGIFVIIKEGSLLGYQFILMIIAIISLTLAIMNVLPIPALDGGRLFVTLIFRGLKRKLLPHTEEMIHGAGFVSLMLLFVLITIVDVKRFF